MAAAPNNKKQTTEEATKEQLAAWHITGVGGFDVAPSGGPFCSVEFKPDSLLALFSSDDSKKANRQLHLQCLLGAPRSGVVAALKALMSAGATRKAMHVSASGLYLPWEPDCGAGTVHWLALLGATVSPAWGGWAELSSPSVAVGALSRTKAVVGLLEFVTSDEFSAALPEILHALRHNLHAYIESRIPQTMIRHFALHVFEGYVFATQRAAVAAGSKALKAPKTLRPDTLTRVAALLECPDHGPNALYAEICDDRGAVLRAYIDVLRGAGDEEGTDEVSGATRKARSLVLMILELVTPRLGGSGFVTDLGCAAEALHLPEAAMLLASVEQVLRTATPAAAGGALDVPCTTAISFYKRIGQFYAYLRLLFFVEEVEEHGTRKRVWEHPLVDGSALQAALPRERVDAAFARGGTASKPAGASARELQAAAAAAEADAVMALLRPAAPAKAAAKQKLPGPGAAAAGAGGAAAGAAGGSSARVPAAKRPCRSSAGVGSDEENVDD